MNFNSDVARLAVAERREPWLASISNLLLPVIKAPRPSPRPATHQRNAPEALYARLSNQNDCPTETPPHG
jgi:hypothetical protein